MNFVMLMSLFFGANGFGLGGFPDEIKHLNKRITRELLNGEFWKNLEKMNDMENMDKDDFV